MLYNVKKDRKSPCYNIPDSLSSLWDVDLENIQKMNFPTKAAVFRRLGIPNADRPILVPEYDAFYNSISIGTCFTLLDEVDVDTLVLCCSLGQNFGAVVKAIVVYNECRFVCQFGLLNRFSQSSFDRYVFEVSVDGNCARVFEKRIIIGRGVRKHKIKK